MKITVLHSYYGCDTGCCGHIIEVDGEQRGRFEFDHPSDYKVPEDKLEWAKNFVREQMGEEHVKDLDWDNCEVSYD